MCIILRVIMQKTTNIKNCLWGHTTFGPPSEKVTLWGRENKSAFTTSYWVMYWKKNAENTIKSPFIPTKNQTDAKQKPQYFFSSFLSKCIFIIWEQILHTLYGTFTESISEQTKEQDGRVYAILQYTTESTNAAFCKWEKEKVDTSALYC